MKQIITIIGLAALLTACGSTDTAGTTPDGGDGHTCLGIAIKCSPPNPESGENAPEEENQYSDNHMLVYELVEHTCDVVSACDPKAAAECELGVSMAFLSDEFGATDDEELNLRDLAGLVTDGDYVIDLDVLGYCGHAIKDIDCKEITNLSMTDAHDFWQIEEVLPKECGADFADPLFVAQ